MKNSYDADAQIRLTLGDFLREEKKIDTLMAKLTLKKQVLIYNKLGESPSTQKGIEAAIRRLIEKVGPAIISGKELE